MFEETRLTKERSAYGEEKSNWPAVCSITSVLLWERERTKNTNRLALAMGEVVHRAGWVFLRTSDLEAFRFALAMGEGVQRSGRLFLLHPRHQPFRASP